MDNGGNALGAVIMLIFALVVFGGAAAFILVAIRAKTKRNSAFLARALTAQELPPVTVVQAPFTTAQGPHAVWLDLSLTGQEDQMAFELWLFVRTGVTTLLEGTFNVNIDDEGNTKGLPNAFGTSALNSVHSMTLGKQTMTSVLRAFRFDARPGEQAEVRARIAYPIGVTVTRARLLVTAGDSPM